MVLFSALVAILVTSACLALITVTLSQSAARIRPALLGRRQHALPAPWLARASLRQPVRVVRFSPPARRVAA